jgi:hypothetical protein
MTIPPITSLQDAVIAAVAPTAIVFEMITAAEAALVTPDLAVEAGALSDTLEWAASGWPDFAMYAPLFAHAVRAAIYGAQVPRDAAQEAFATGAAAVFPGDAARFGLTEALDPDEQAAREAEQQEAHCNALPEEILPGFVEAQRLRDAALAEAALARWRTRAGRWWSSRATDTRAPIGVCRRCWRWPRRKWASSRWASSRPNRRQRSPSTRGPSPTRWTGPTPARHSAEWNGRIAAARLGSCSPTGRCASFSASPWWG